VVSEEWLQNIRAQMPSLPHELYKKFVEEFKIPEYDASVLTDIKEVALFFEAVCHYTSNFKAVSNWVMGPVKSYLNEQNLSVKNFPLSPEKLAGLIELIDSNKVSYSVAAQKIFPVLLKEAGKTAVQVAEEQNLMQESNSDLLQALINEVLASNAQKVKEYKNGKKGLLGMFMGEVMKKSKGKADPKLANELLSKTLSEA
jgi:aspartyl-tRNA(Asn)/glutamyl-tRNA(Gln) amidotransferase subunit B